jgi:hypothetical protein
MADISQKYVRKLQLRGDGIFAEGSRPSATCFQKGKYFRLKCLNIHLVFIILYIVFLTALLYFKIHQFIVVDPVGDWKT